MAHEKLFTARQAADAVLKKTQELLVKSALMKAEGYSSQNPKKENAKPSEHGSKDAEQHANGKGPKGEIHPKEKEEAPSDNVRAQAAPDKNPKEQAEGNNELAGTTPNQVGQDGKNIAGFDEMKGHLKLAKFIGHMESKRKIKLGVPNG